MIPLFHKKTFGCSGFVGSQLTAKCARCGNPMFFGGFRLDSAGEAGPSPISHTLATARRARASVLPWRAYQAFRGIVKDFRILEGG